jgi:hypothetical protein
MAWLRGGTNDPRGHIGGPSPIQKVGMNFVSSRWRIAHLLGAGAEAG